MQKTERRVCNSADAIVLRFVQADLLERLGESLIVLVNFSDYFNALFAAIGTGPTMEPSPSSFVRNGAGLFLRNRTAAFSVRVRISGVHTGFELGISLTRISWLS